MKCPRCGGTAYAYGCEDENGKMPIRCPWCGYSEVQTNEEWFCSLPTKEKAKWLSRHSRFIYGCGQKGQIPKALYEEDWEFWLKEKNNDK